MGITITNSGQGSVVRFRNLGRGGVMTSTKLPIPLPLDSYPGATLMYSFRKLRSLYTGNAIRVRRSSDNAEQNIGFVNNVLDTAALLTFCGAGNGFVTTWYDQSGNSNNAYNGSAPAQPQIVFSGALLIKNSRIYITASTNQWFILTTAINLTPTQSYSWWFIYEKAAVGNTAVFTNGGGAYFWLDYGNTAQYINNSQVINISPFSYAINTQYLVNNINASPTVTMHANGIARGSTTTSANSGFAEFPLQGFHSTMTMTELIYYPIDQSANRLNISANINSYYTIY